ncbi:MAG: carbohydrate-binding family 9-like protein [Planctomycetes bacterium]|nr:carbohydrate-binding family 9-like protein [Planctomycetota bacterium]
MAILLGAVGLCAGGCGVVEKKKESEIDIVQHRAYYACPRNTKPIVIDGKLDEEAWGGAEAIGEFSLPPQHRSPVHATRAWMTWDTRAIYLAFKVVDPDIKAVHTERDSDTYRDDVVEFFFTADPRRKRYYNFEFNPLGVFKDEYHTPARRFQTDWNCSGTTVGVDVDGTLNDSTDRDAGWQLEVAIPFESRSAPDDRTPEPGDVWLFHLARIDRSVGLEGGKELSSTAPLEKIWFHDSRRWLPLVFQGPRRSVKLQKQ